MLQLRNQQPTQNLKKTAKMIKKKSIRAIFYLCTSDDKNIYVYVQCSIFDKFEFNF